MNCFEFQDAIIFVGDEVLVNLQFYGITAFAKGHVLEIKTRDSFKVRWCGQDASALRLDSTWEWVLLESVVDVRGLAPPVPCLIRA